MTQVKLIGDELGSWSNMKELRHKALVFAERFIGQSVLNVASGHEILINKSGVSHTLAGAQDLLIRTVPAIPALLENATWVASEKDNNNDPNVLAVEKYTVQLSIDDVTHEVLMIVKLYKDKRRYYDHGFVKKNSKPLLSG